MSEKKVVERVLLLDIETSPNVGYTWGKWEQNVLEFIKEGQIICFAWKWLGEKSVGVRSLPMYGKTYINDREDNSDLVFELKELYDKADTVIGHNLFAFDDKVSNMNFLLNGLKPPPPHKVIDTLKVAKKFFRFNSNKLNDLGKRLGVGQKSHTGGFKLWLDCLAGDKPAWKKMEDYNKQDVVLLERVYLKFKPWIERPKRRPDGRFI